LSRYIEEDARTEVFIQECREKRAEKIAMLRQHYKENRWGRYVPPPEPAWMRGEEELPWRRESDRPTTSRAAIEGLVGRCWLTLSNPR
jgi:hypothetical protein